MLDFFHFWSGLNKFEDLDLLEPGELAHAHCQDLLAGPRELIDNDSRLIPGDGIAPLERIIRKLSEKGYAGALSVELFRSDIVNADPFATATEISREMRSRDAGRRTCCSHPRSLVYTHGGADIDMQSANARRRAPEPNTSCGSERREAPRLCGRPDDCS